MKKLLFALFTLISLSASAQFVKWSKVPPNTDSIGARNWMDIPSLLSVKLNISDTSTMLMPYAKKHYVDSVVSAMGSASSAGKLNISDTAAMLLGYSRVGSTALKVNISDTAGMLMPYARKSFLSAETPATYNSTTGHIGVDTNTLATKNYVLNRGYLSSIDTTDISNFYKKVRNLISANSPATYTTGTGKVGVDTSILATQYYVSTHSSSGGVTSVDDGWGIAGGPITTSGTLRADSSEVTSVYKNSLKLNISDTASMLGPYAQKLFLSATAPLSYSSSTGIISGDTSSGTTHLATQNYANTKSIADVNLVPWKTPVRCASTGYESLPLSTGVTIDGVTLTYGDRFLLKDQGGVENGIYYIIPLGQPSAGQSIRSQDANDVNEVNQAVVRVISGTVNSGKNFIQTNNSTSSIGSFTQSWDAFAPGTVTSVADGWGIAGGTITTSGTLRADSSEVTSVYKNSLKLNISDTASMLDPYYDNLTIVNDLNDIGTPIAFTDIDITGATTIDVGASSAYRRFRLVSTNTDESVNDLINSNSNYPFWIYNGAINVTIYILSQNVGGIYEDCFVGMNLLWQWGWASGRIEMPKNSESRILCKQIIHPDGGLNTRVIQILKIEIND